MYALSIETNSNVCFIYRDKFKCMVYLKRQIQMYGLYNKDCTIRPNVGYGKTYNFGHRQLLDHVLK